VGGAAERQEIMKQKSREFEAALAEEAAAMKQLAKAFQSKTNAELKIIAARKRLSLARSASYAVKFDLMAFGITK